MPGLLAEIVVRGTNLPSSLVYTLFLVVDDVSVDNQDSPLLVVVLARLRDLKLFAHERGLDTEYEVVSIRLDTIHILRILHLVTDLATLSYRLFVVRAIRIRLFLAALLFI